MDQTESLVAKLCDQLTFQVQCSDLNLMRETVKGIVEYSAYALARTAGSEYSVSMFLAAEEVGRIFDRASKKVEHHSAQIVPFM